MFIIYFIYLCGCYAKCICCGCYVKRSKKCLHSTPLNCQLNISILYLNVLSTTRLSICSSDMVANHGSAIIAKEGVLLFLFWRTSNKFISPTSTFYFVIITINYALYCIHYLCIIWYPLIIHYMVPINYALYGIH